MNGGKVDGRERKNVSHDGLLRGKPIADIVVTHHARSRWVDRVETEKTGFHDITAFLWSKLKSNSIQPYYKNEQDVYLIDEDLVMVAEFVKMDTPESAGEPETYKMIVVTFLGRMSETMELRDLRSYYSWLRHSRRMTLIKNSRKRR
ncbi:hypothetical protein [Paenibacillus ehimensis]|uniref:Periplasmic protein n=1 Tax=Paenibacillus ehimensis TaxID=79264 RepID=A0ABT8V882_9BACL|nr:hypothetical protein [Paenibacillus ehimensis]MDO3677665.1 hypothetical protein [Paenibacillus ehimensis]MEC0209640.1 hypothetical protein [Paenibacillus ehimensis]